MKATIRAKSCNKLGDQIVVGRAVGGVAEAGWAEAGPAAVVWAVEVAWVAADEAWAEERAILTGRRCNYLCSQRISSRWCRRNLKLTSATTTIASLPFIRTAARLKSQKTQAIRISTPSG